MVSESVNFGIESVERGVGYVIDIERFGPEI
jgi:hypothetical protein